MKKWKCTVCGYIHEGEAPPAECPLCKAPAEKFIEIVEDVGHKRWKCTVCGYIHAGALPPESCPICKAGPEKFIEIDGSGEAIISSAGPMAASGGASPAPVKKPGLLVRLIMALHIHPISVHFPNGVLPVVVVFLAFSVFFGFVSFETAAYYNLIFVLLTMPVVLGSGYLEWRNRYQGAKTFLFLTKIACSVVVTVALLILVLWWYIDPRVAAADSPVRLVYFGIAVVMLAAAGIAGHLGGKLVFGGRK